MVQEVDHGQLGTGEAQLWAGEQLGMGSEPGRGTEPGRGLGAALAEQEPSHFPGQPGGRREYPMQEDFLLHREGMRSQSLKVNNQMWAQERAVGLEG